MLRGGISRLIPTRLPAFVDKLGFSLRTNFYVFTNADNFRRETKQFSLDHSHATAHCFLSLLFPFVHS